MCLLDDSLLQLHQQGVVDYVDVVTRVQDPEKLKSLKRK